jgi:hypothetical protein
LTIGHQTELVKERGGHARDDASWSRVFSNASFLAQSKTLEFLFADRLKDVSGSADLYAGKDDRILS